jgi:8-oxo-dGTP diphosphatase
MEQKPDFAIRVLVFKEGKVLLGENKQSTHVAKYIIPGGHLEYLESFKKCIERELKEECGIEVENIVFQSVSNITEYDPWHNVHLTFTAEWKTGEPRALESEKIDSWDWYDLDNLPEPLFKNVQLALESHKTGKDCFDAQ